MNNELTQSIEAILFATSEPQSVHSLAGRLEVGESEVHEALQILATQYEHHGIMLLVHDNKATLVTRPEQSKIIERLRRDELQRELSKASAETLAVIAYYPGATKAQIEFIRGVNVAYTLRSLQIRGLVEQKGAGRSVTYHPTVEMLEHFGVGSAEDLPDYAETKQKLTALLERDIEETV